MNKTVLQFTGIVEQRPTETDQLIGKETECYYIKTVLQLDQVSHWYENKMFSRLFPDFTENEVISVELKSGSYVVLEYDLEAFTAIMENYTYGR